MFTFKSSQVNEKKFSLGDGNIILFPYAINCASFYFSNIFYFICRNLCPNGTYSLGAQIKCTICLPGSKCPSITEGPTICPPGYFSETNAAECKLCEAGKQCADPACEFLFFLHLLNFVKCQVCFFHKPALSCVSLFSVLKK